MDLFIRLKQFAGRTRLSTANDLSCADRNFKWIRSVASVALSYHVHSLAKSSLLGSGRGILPFVSNCFLINLAKQLLRLPITLKSRPQCTY